MTKSISILGLMSGSSLDGMDLALVDFITNEKGDISSWELKKAKSIPFTAELKKTLFHATSLSGKELWLLHTRLGQYFGHAISKFISKHHLDVDLIASHGHTVFHYPVERMTCQIGDPSAIAAVTGVPTMADFRATDIALGGQGAPLAPLADSLLFSQYDYFLNLGGITNLSSTSNQHKIAFDICGCNQLLNHFANKAGLDYDEGGELAKSGACQDDLMAFLDNWSYYATPLPKSLDNSEVQELIIEIGQSFDHKVEDSLNTLTQHMAIKIAAAFLDIKDGSGEILVSGGGAFNSYLVEQTQAQLGDRYTLTIPEPTIIEFKEAILMALAGLRRWYKLPIFDHKMTGASHSASGGGLFLS